MTKRVFLLIFILIIIASVLFPLYFLLVMSLGLNFRKKELIPSVISLEGYQYVFFEHPYFRVWLINSFFYTVCSTIGILLTGIIAGYIFSRYNFHGKTILFWIVLITMMIPSAVIYIPQYLVVSQLGLLDSVAGIILPLICNPYCIFLFKQACDSIPREYEEAAMIDGADAANRIFRIIVPILKPVILAVGAIQFVWNWNNFTWPLFVVSTSELFNLAYGVYNFSYSQSPRYPALGALALINMLFPLLVYIILLKYVLKGVLIMGAK